MMGRVRTAFMLGLATGAIGVLLSLVPFISSLEDTLGLRVFFQIRGPLPAPGGVVVVSIDEAATIALDLPRRVRDWPRAYHARLIERLVEQGASVIAFDLQFFRDTSAADDDALARAIASSRRVVLVQQLERISGSTQDLYPRQDPIPAFASVATGLAPAPVPHTPLVSWFWTFLPTTGGEEVPTLPAVALQAGAARLASTIDIALRAAGVEPRVRQIGTSSELRAYMHDLRQQLKGNTSTLSRVLEALATSQQIASQDKPLARAVAALYAGDAAPYLNFYGPPGSLCTLPYEAALAGTASPCPIEGSTVFVGVGRSRLERAEQIDTYHTIYERPNGVDFSGVELHATAFANLLTGTALHPLNPSASLAILVGAGLVLGGSGYLTRTRRRRLRGSMRARLEAAGIVVLLLATYSVLAYALFARVYVIVPIVIPLAVQLPTALILGLLVRPAVHEEQVQTVCVAADAGGSTAIGQQLPHGAYAVLMTEYNRVLARCVTTRGGLALPPHGDGFVSLWVVGTGAVDAADVSTRLTACQAALAMVRAADHFNQERPEAERLPLRLGLTLGKVTIRSDADRGAFEAVGDAVNVAARLQELNRELATRVLASEAVVVGTEEQLALNPILRDVELRGVTAPPRVFELVASSSAGGV
jgi:adenylate cyclase